MKNKTNPWLIKLAIFIIIIIVGSCLYFWNSQKSTNQDWSQHTSNKGFSISYPSDWELTTNSGDSGDSSVISLLSPETAAKVKSQESAYTQDINIYYYSTVSEEPENKANDLKATTLDGMINKSTVITEIGSIEIGGQSGTDVIWGGYGAYYTILTTKNSHLYKIQFATSETKADLTDTEREIISSFKFTD